MDILASVKVFQQHVSPGVKSHTARKVKYLPVQGFLNGNSVAGWQQICLLGWLVSCSEFSLLIWGKIANELSSHFTALL